MPARLPADADLTASRRYLSFVVRLAPGASASDSNLFRGQVRHVQSGHEAHFLGFAELESFMQAAMAGETIPESEAATPKAHMKKGGDIAS